MHSNLTHIEQYKSLHGLTTREEAIAPFLPFLRNPAVTEVVVNQPGVVLTETSQGWQKHLVPELTYDSLYAMADNIANLNKQKITEEMPLVSVAMPHGERCQIVLPPATLHGTISFTIRKPSMIDMSLEELSDKGLFDNVQDITSELQPEEKELLTLKAARRWTEFFKLAVQTHKNIVGSGATGSGKSTISKALVKYVPLHERLITIEDVHELKLPHENKVHLLYPKDAQGICKVDSLVLQEATLRMRPDRVFQSEVRSHDIWNYLKILGNGHPGGITTVHANSARYAYKQMALLIRESAAGSQMETKDIMDLLYLLIDIVVQSKKINGKHVVTEIYYDPIRQRQLLD